VRLLELRNALAHDVERALRPILRRHVVAFHHDRPMPGTRHRQAGGQPGHTTSGDREPHPFRLGVRPIGGTGSSVPVTTEWTDRTTPATVREWSGRYLKA